MSKKITDKQNKIDFLQERMKNDKQTIKQLQKEIDLLKREEILFAVQEANISTEQLLHVLARVKKGEFVTGSPSM